ncbi:chorismate mutase [Roseobacter sinensis]|uniref:chorismate mutase n=1 Tax=Roseobacter sinensis TaxID=2931391 RepID=A0ABT3BCS4_9RHOB|nr:chorismate mutase [Roseobacter sp. WL0113]MCV3271362.1 chorismate mutase [Roseobacter sp. WL0113]
MTRTPPHLCADMAELRPQIDEIDAALIDLLVERSGYIDRAAEIKATAGLPACIADRVEEVVANVRRHASARGLDPDLTERIWRQLIDWSIAREEARLGTGPAQVSGAQPASPAGSTSKAPAR